MQLQFQDTPQSYLHSLTCQLKSLEQTQEVRISDSMPDIGSVLGAWGQVLLRSKQWNTGYLGLSAGVMVWILYAPEEGGTPATVEVWIPFQEKMDLPDTAGREGAVHCGFHLTEVDVRNTSARKLFVRVNVDTRAEAMIEEKMAVYTPGELPEDIQLLERSYPVLLPVEAGEKPFELEQALNLPGNCPPLEKVVYYCADPQVQEQKVLTDKVIFRGNLCLHMLYIGQDQQLYSCDQQIPFSQYGELGRDYDPDAAVTVQPVLTALEITPDEQGQLQLNMGMVGQYVISKRQMLNVVQDAYSVGRAVTCEMEDLALPMILDRREEGITASQSMPAEGTRLVDVSFCSRDMRPEQADGQVNGQLQGQFRALWYDMDGNLRGGNTRWEMPWESAADNSTKMQVVVHSDAPQGTISGGDIRMDARMTLGLTTYAGQGIPMVTGLEVGEWTAPDPKRPSLIICRAEPDGLWEIAKANGATVEAIRKANKLESDPTPGQLLLIPIS